MDGLPESLKPWADVGSHRTLKTSIGCVGVGLHSGQRVNLTLLPAAPNSGIIFRRTDLDATIAARYDNVAISRLCTMLARDGQDASVSTVEHLMAALAAAGV